MFILSKKYQLPSNIKGMVFKFMVHPLTEKLISFNFKNFKDEEIGEIFYIIKNFLNVDTILKRHLKLIEKYYFFRANFETKLLRKLFPRKWILYLLQIFREENIGFIDYDSDNENDENGGYEIIQNSDIDYQYTEKERKDINFIWRNTGNFDLM